MRVTVLDQTTDLHEAERQVAADTEPALQHDGDSIDVGEVQVAQPEPEREAEVVPIDDGSRTKHPAGGTLASKVLTLLQSSPGEEFTPSDIFDEIEDSTYGGVQSTIAGLVRNGQVERVGRGKYTAATS